MTSITIEPNKRLSGQFYDTDNDLRGDISLRRFELNLSEDDDGIDFFMRNAGSSNNETYIFTVLSPDEADLLADNLRRLAEQSRRIMNQV